MPPSKHNVQLQSTHCSLRPTDGYADNKQMVDTPDFRDRWEIALKMNGVENPWVAEQLGPTPQHGQSLINRWKSRGRIGGGRSERRVAELLPKTNIAWLQYNDGQPDRINPFEPQPTDARPSHLLRPDPAMLVSAYSTTLYGLGMYGDGRQDLNLHDMLDAIRLCDVYALLAKHGGGLPGGESSLELKAVIEQRANQTGGMKDGKIGRSPGAKSTSR